jgi:hypothetical protein
MRNRAKCKLCKNIIESKHLHDYVTCPCGEISIDGGSGGGYIRSSARDPNNLVYVDDEDNEILIQSGCKPDEEVKSEEISSKPTKKEMMDMLHDMAMNIEKLPDHAKFTSVTHVDFQMLILLLESILRRYEEDNKKEVFKEKMQMSI